ncbi:MAG: isoprenoid biosynthesis glyoxalase ElbB, partial [Bacteroidetes bacterium]|nr:isoprenoid biosynthesis glyoxalase ElbB [Bacteroidota bacterium]
DTKKFAVILSGNGVFDGAEIHEATMTLYAIAKNGGEYEIFAPDIKQHHVINHITGEEMDETRNVLIESARIARGNIKPLSVFSKEDFDAIVFPGGFGVAKNLCSFAFDNVDCTVNPEVERVIKEMAAAKKPIGALCISPVLIARVLGNITVTIGQDTGTAESIEKLGAIHKNRGHGEVVDDEANKIVTTPCYMLDANIAQIAEGAEAVIKAILKML